MVRRSTAAPQSIIVPPLQGGTPFLSVPGVETPGSVLLSLRDKPDSETAVAPTDEQELIPTGSGC
jgi:hypothetical protein